MLKWGCKATIVNNNDRFNITYHKTAIGPFMV